MIGDALQRTRIWIREPVTTRHRICGASIGAFAGFWSGLACWAVLHRDLSAPSGFVPWGLAGAGIVMCLGMRWPKQTLLVLSPLLYF
jgi:hypothetical protein